VSKYTSEKGGQTRKKSTGKIVGRSDTYNVSSKDGTSIHIVPAALTPVHENPLYKFLGIDDDSRDVR